METWVPKVEKSINTKNTKIIKASQGMVLLPGIEEEDHDHGGEEHHHEYDPHVWLSPKRSQKLVETIRDGLIAQHPDKKAVFTTNAEKYLKKLKTLDKEYTEALSQAKQKSFVTQHSAFAYLALDYGLTQVQFLVFQLNLIHLQNVSLAFLSMSKNMILTISTLRKMLQAALPKP